ncbi:MAG: restriction endonuclease [Candidatus Thiodiazotropha endolucinida]
MKAWKKFEKLTERIFAQLIKNPEYEKVEHNVSLVGKDGARQVDVLITSQVAGMEVKTIVECKDYKDKVSIGVIGELHSLMQDVNANKGVVVSSNGFSSKAISKAKRLGISLYTAHEALSDKWKLDIEIPVLVIEISTVDVIPEYTAPLNKTITLSKSKIFIINDIDVIKEFTTHLNGLSPDELFSLNKVNNVYYPPSIAPPLFTRDVRGEKIPIDTFGITFGVSRKYYFGYLNNQRDVLALRDILENSMKVSFKPDFILNFKNSLTEINENEIPSVGELRVACLIKPTFEDLQLDHFNITRY